MDDMPFIEFTEDDVVMAKLPDSEFLIGIEQTMECDGSACNGRPGPHLHLRLAAPGRSSKVLIFVGSSD